MKKFKRLNRKGFTLIELLAVIVILAVVMGIAANSVLSSMNKSRMGSMSDSAIVVARGLDQKFLEAQVGGTVSSVSVGGKVYNFSKTNMYYLHTDSLKEFNLKTSDYVGDTANSISPVDLTNNVTGVNKSFVVFNGTKSSFIVCLVANKSGSLFVDGMKVTNGKLAKADSGLTVDILFDTTDGVMFACSNGTKSK